VLSELAFTDPAASPRKVPLQARAQATVTAILEATFRVLGEDGAAITTTRVAEVAGVSVGTLYQYFPNREAMVHALLAEHLEVAARTVEDAAGDGGEPRAVVIERVVRAVLAVKAERAPVSERLNRVFAVGGLDDRPLGAPPRAGRGQDPGRGRRAGRGDGDSRRRPVRSPRRRGAHGDQRGPVAAARSGVGRAGGRVRAGRRPVGRISRRGSWRS
jgi:AcrR family transcriptional regulator